MTLPAIAQLAEHLTVDCCSKQMVPGAIPGGRMYNHTRIGESMLLCIWSIKRCRAGSMSAVCSDKRSSGHAREHSCVQYKAIGCIFATNSVIEWLRSRTRHPPGSARRGSNPLAVAQCLYGCELAGHWFDTQKAFRSPSLSYNACTGASSQVLGSTHRGQ